MVAEFFLAIGGLGYYILFNSRTFHHNEAFVGVLLLAAFGLGFELMVNGARGGSCRGIGLAKPLSRRRRIMRVVTRRLILGMVAVAGSSLHAAAQDYPTRNVTVMVPFAPGGGTDLIARTVGQKLEERTGKSFIIENRPVPGRRLPPAKPPTQSPTAIR